MARTDNVRTRLKDTPGYIPVGAPPEDPAHAWWALSRAAKAKLAELRATGEYGGTPGRAPYWLSQDQGNPAAAIEAQHYIGLALDAWRSQVELLLADYLRR